MKPGTKILIEIGETTISDIENSTAKAACTNVVLTVNGVRHERVCMLSPAQYATPENIMANIVKDRLIYEPDKNLERKG